MTTTLSGESEYRLLIGGEFQPGGDGTYDIINPATEEVVGAAPEGSVAQAQAAAAEPKAEEAAEEAAPAAPAGVVRVDAC